MNFTARYGWIPSVADPRNVEALVPDVPVAKEVDPRWWLPGAYNQFQIGSCTGNATAAVFRGHFIQAKADPGDFSRLWIYLRERMWEGTPPSQDSGAQGHTAYKVARKIGLALEEDWPYNEGRDFAGPSPAAAVRDAINHRIKTYSHPARDLEVFKKILSNNQLISFGFEVGSWFESSTVANTGVYEPRTGDRIIGGHEIVVVGYVFYQGVEYALLRNSWGTEWGQGGYFLAPWSFVLGSLSSDFRTVDPA
jgi:C1A family cysteine protease